MASDRSSESSAADLWISAISQGRVTLAAQPIFGAPRRNGDILYQECFARLLTTESECIPPIDGRDQADLLDRHVLSLVLDQLEHDSSAVLGCNISAKTFMSPKSFESLFDQLLARAPLLPRLVIELTEAVELTNLAYFSGIFSKLQQLGCRIGLDDFGSIHASSRAFEFPNFDIVKMKIDFINITDHQSIRNSDFSYIAGLASCFAPIVVIEGIENSEQVDLARAVGATHLQGYPLSRYRVIG